MSVSAQTPITLQVSSETAPAGGWAQFKIYAAQPVHAGSGILSMDFDPTVFGDIAQVAVFGANGDALGYAQVNGRHVDAHFTSSSNSAGQLPGLPIAVVTVPVNASIAPGTKTAVTLNAATTGVDSFGPVTVIPGEFTVGGSLSVRSIAPGYGLWPQGTVLQIDGAGFTASTAVTADGVSLSAVQLVSPQQINVTLGGATELMGKRFRVADGAASLDFYASPPSAPAPPPSPFVAPSGVQPLFPLTTPFLYAVPGNYLMESPAGIEALALLNENPSPAVVTMQAYVPSPGSTVGEPATVTVAAWSVTLLDASTILRAAFAYPLWIHTTVPIHMLSLTQVNPSTPGFVVRAETGSLTPGGSIQVPSFAPIVWSWQQGTPPPPPVTADLPGNLSFHVTASAPWLTVTPASGTAPATVTATPNLSSLKPGNYSATITTTPVVPATLPGVLPEPTTSAVSLTVSAGPLLMSPWSGGNVLQVTAGSAPVTSTLPVTTNGYSTFFTVTFSTASGGSWLAVTPLSGSTPANLTVTVTPGQLAAGTYQGSIVITSPQDKLTAPVTMIISPPPPPPGPLTAMPASLSFAMESGTSSSGAAQPVYLQPLPLTIGTPVASASWLTVMVYSSGPTPALEVNASAAGLAAGIYQGTVTINAAKGSGSVQIPVTLTVTTPLGSQPPLVSTPASLTLTAPAGETAMASFTVTSGGVPVFFSASSQLFEVSQNCNYGGKCVTPSTITVTANAQQLGLGTYSGSVVLQSDSGSFKVPITLQVTNGVSAVSSPGAIFVSQVVNGASFASGPLAPGEIITVLGTSIGPYATGLAIGADGKVARSLNGTQLLINGIAAPLLYASPNQLNAIVPYEVGTSGTATVQVMANGQQSAVWGVPLTPSAPGIFALNASGVGQGAVLNQDNSVNGPANPAARNSVIQIFATGEGLTSPAGVTGSITQNNLNKPMLPVSVLIGGVEAALEYDGSAPDAVEGLLQVNAVVPVGAPSGLAVPIVLKIGDQPSANGVTVAVR